MRHRLMAERLGFNIPYNRYVEVKAGERGTAKVLITRLDLRSYVSVLLASEPILAREVD